MAYLKPQSISPATSRIMKTVQSLNHKSDLYLICYYNVKPNKKGE